MNYKRKYGNIRKTKTVKQWYAQLGIEVESEIILDWSDILKVSYQLVQFTKHKKRDVLIPLGFVWEAIVIDNFKGWDKKIKTNDYLDYNFKTDFICNNIGYQVKLSPKFPKNLDYETIDKCMERYNLKEYYIIVPDNAFKIR